MVPLTFELFPCLAGKQVGAGEGGKYRVVLDSDERRFGGAGRVGHDTDHFTSPEGEPGGFASPLRYCLVRVCLRCLMSSMSESSASSGQSAAGVARALLY